MACGKRIRFDQKRRSRKMPGHTVYTKMSTMPMKTAKNTQAVQTLVLSPLNKLAVMAAEMAIVVENSNWPTSKPSFRAEGEKYPYRRMKNTTADCKNAHRYSLRQQAR